MGRERGNDGVDVFRKLARGGPWNEGVVVRGGLDVFLPNEAADCAKLEGMVNAREVLGWGFEVDAGFRNGAEIDKVIKRKTRAGRALSHIVIPLKAERMFSSEVEERNVVVSIVRGQESMADPCVFGCGDGKGWTREGSTPSRLARNRAKSK